MRYNVMVGKRAVKNAAKMPQAMQERLQDLIDDLRESGPIQPTWPNYSALSATTYHCHLNYRWVACWRHEKGTIEIEVYYAGSREGAPY